MAENTEIWKDVVGHEGDYLVSNRGLVKSTNPNIIVKVYVITGGYQRVYLSSDKNKSNKGIHQIVAESFLNHKPNGHSIVVDHIDCDPTNNHLINLQLLTQRENTSRKKRGTSKHTGVCWDKKRGKWQATIFINGKNRFLGRHVYEKDALNAYQVALEKTKDNGR